MARRCFGGSTEDHAASYRQALADIDGATQTVRELLDRGSCRQAFRHLKMVQQRLGNLASHWSYARSAPTMPSERRSVDEREERVGTLWTRWANHCVLPGRR